MAVTFRIIQGGVPGAWGRARRDITPFSVGGLVTLEASAGSLTYLWEVLTKPYDAVPVLATPNAITTTLNTEARGGYLIRVTADAGLPTEDVMVLYLGIALDTSLCVLPASNESNQDNSQPPFFDGREGWWEKLERWLKWADTAISIILPDIAWQDQVLDMGLNNAPAAIAGDRYIVGTAPIGLWAGHPDDIAEFDGIDWIFTTKEEGFVAYVISRGTWYAYDGSAWVLFDPSIRGFAIYVDSINGSDVTGDGTLGQPYATLAFACAQQAAPTSADEFITPVTFFVGPGAQTGPVTLPIRLHMTIVGQGCLFTGDIDWGIDPSQWVTWALNPGVDLPHLQFTRDAARLDIPEITGFTLSTGTLTVFNSNPGFGNQMPVHHVSMNGVNRELFGIYNEPAGTGDLLDAPRTLKLFLHNSFAVGSCPIAGECDRDMVGMVLEENEVVVTADRSHVSMYGTCAIHQLIDCVYFADYRLGHDGIAPYAHGRIQGDNTVNGDLNVIRSEVSGKWGGYFGFDPAAPAPAHAMADAIRFDRVSLVQLASTTSSMTTSFSGFDNVSSADMAYGRGWWYEEDDFYDCSHLVIPNGDAFGAYRLLSHTNLYSANFRPNGSTLSDTNHLTVELESGRYYFEADFTLSTDYVDFIGPNGRAIKGASISEPSVEFFLNGNAFSSSAMHGSLQGVNIRQHAGPGVTNQCLLLTSASTHQTYKNMVFSKTATSAGTVYAVMIDPGVPVVTGTWEDCHTDLDRFLYGGSLGSGTVARRCSAGRNSFASWAGVTDLDVVCEGTYIDCDAGQYSFGSIYCGNPAGGGGNATFSATATRCTVKSSGFGYTYSANPSGPFTATCSGSMTDCDNYSTGGNSSFGVSNSGPAVCSGTFTRCTSGKTSFGVSSSPGQPAVFSGTAVDCTVGDTCFGVNTATLADGLLSGTCDRCSAGLQSFSAGGELTGTVRRCRAGYGSFGNTITYHRAKILYCEVDDIVNGVGKGAPGVFGALVLGCKFIVKPGENAAALNINGGVGVQSTRIFNCDLYTDTHATSIDSTVGPVEAQIAHCRMNVNIHADITNLIAIGYNVVDLNYDAY